MKRAIKISPLPASLSLALVIALTMGAFLFPSSVAQQSGAVVKSEFIYETAPFPSCHASTIVQTPEGLVTAWFGGKEEGALDVNIWMSRNAGAGWSRPVEAATGFDEANRVHYPCWNPVLFKRRQGPLYLFYKVGPSPSSWWGMVKKSDDNGLTWSKARRLPPNIIGPVRNKPLELVDGTIFCGSSTEDAGWRVHMERTKDPFGEWTRTKPLNDPMMFHAIQPTILYWPGRYQILCRSKINGVVEAWADATDFQWKPMTETGLPNPSSALDAVMLNDGRALLVYNHTKRGRGRLNVALSRDGKIWEAAGMLENTPGAEFSYPAVIQTSDGLVHITYTWRRELIKHVVLNPSKLSGTSIVDGEWPETAGLLSGSN